MKKKNDQLGTTENDSAARSLDEAQLEQVQGGLDPRTIVQPTVSAIRVTQTSRAVRLIAVHL